MRSRALLTQQEHNAGCRGKENEFLAKCVEHAVIKINRRHDIGDVSLVNRYGIEQIAVRPRIIAEARQRHDCPEQQQSQSKCANEK